MNKFGPDTVVRYGCEECDKVELVKLGDIQTTPEGTFIMPTTVQCITCLNEIFGVIYDEDQI
jgi:hypothetical protein